VLEYAIIFIVALAGYTDASAWLVIAGGVALTIEGWAMKFRLLREQPSVALSSKIATYFVTGIAGNMFLAALSFGVGQIVRAWMS
jgi:hypothetical protein